MKDKLKYCLYLALLYPIALLPHWALYLLSDLLYLILGKALKYRKKVVVQNLETSFPDKSPGEIKELQHRFYRHFCDIIVETIKLLHVSDRSLKKRIQVENWEAVDRIAAAGKPAILMLGHLGNWEYVTGTTMYFTPKMHSYHIYKPLRDKAADRLMWKIRERFPSHGIDQAHAVRTILALRQQGNPFMVGFIADQRSNSPVAHQRIDFLNHMTPYNVGGETIGDKIGAEFLYLDISQPRRGYYLMRFVPMHPADDGRPNPYTRLYMKLLEENIIRQPWLWLWSHRRWLYK